MDQTLPFNESGKTDHHTASLAAAAPAHDKFIEVVPAHENQPIGVALAQAPTLETVATRTNKDVLAVIGIQILVLLLMILLTMQYSWLHSVPHILSPLFGNQDIDEFADAIANYNFVGVTVEGGKPSIFAVVLEVAIWSLAGVLARSEYFLAQIVVSKKPFNFWETSSKLISDGSMGIAIAIAVVLFLRATQFVNLSLENADVASIAAISFILGFYHEDTRRLLGSFRRKISQSSDESGEK